MRIAPLRKGRTLAIAIGVLIFVGAMTALVAGQNGHGYDLSWSTVDGGGGTSVGGEFRLMGTAGQPDAGAMSGGDLILTGGFWSSVRPTYNVFVPLVLRNYR